MNVQVYILRIICMYSQNQPTMPAKANGVLDGLSRQHVGEPSVTRTLGEEGRGRDGW